MIDYKDIEKIYGMRIAKKYKTMLGDKIFDDWPQEMISKALEYDLSDADYNELFLRGMEKSKFRVCDYPGLYHICIVFIHPITKLQALAENVNRLVASFN